MGVGAHAVATPTRSGLPSARPPVVKTVPLAEQFVDMPGETIQIYVDPAVQQKILDGHAVPLAPLLYNDPNLGTMHLEHERDEKEKKDKDRLKDVNMSLGDFTLAFCRYMAIAIEAYPHLAPGLNTHLHQVHQVAKEGGDWLSFDAQVRKHIQFGKRQWGAG